MTPEFEKVESQLPDFQYVDRDNDRIIVTVGFTAAFYFFDGHTVEKRLALVDCIEAYETAYGNHLTWACDPDSWKPSKLSKKTQAAFRDYSHAKIRYARRDRGRTGKQSTPCVPFIAIALRTGREKAEAGPPELG
ncbi:hypothetical protein [Rugamonas sp. DEMB1]|uniref:hypothetical protein n=1 Tax=Rugamonas sp. DEMB1 TaxID=3039386 RepID=UPI00244D32CF|nr:hypothetical protein [Rugamonas sp. DEMB1]WGG52409.1 hypothetical protein QC826_09800 [Rugamonas sp. DEMB1]